MTETLDRARLLIAQDRMADAARYVRQALAEDPDDAIAHALMSMCLCRTEKLEEATKAAQRAISLAPDEPLGHYVLTEVLQDRNRPKEAEVAINEAIRLDPEDPDYYSLLATVNLQQKKWNDALQSAEQGLQCDPEHAPCSGIRALALNQLGRHDEASAATTATLGKNPDDAFSQAAHGWALLRGGQADEARTHFREALRIDPLLDWAQLGMVEAIKARFLIYRLLLRYFFWMSTLSGRGRWAVFISSYVIFRASRNLLKTNPELKFVLIPIVAGLGIFFLMTWIADPLSNLVLRLSPDGRWAMTRDDRVSSNLVGLCIVGIVVFIIAAAASGSSQFYIPALLCYFLIVPISGTFSCTKGWPRTTMTAYTW